MTALQPATVLKPRAQLQALITLIAGLKMSRQSDTQLGLPADAQQCISAEARKPHLCTLDWVIHLPLHALLQNGAQHLLHLVPLELQLL